MYSASYSKIIRKSQKICKHHNSSVQTFQFENRFNVAFNQNHAKYTCSNFEHIIYAYQAKEYIIQTQAKPTIMGIDLQVQLIHWAMVNTSRQVA